MKQVSDHSSSRSAQLMRGPRGNTTNWKSFAPSRLALGGAVDVEDPRSRLAVEKIGWELGRVVPFLGDKAGHVDAPLQPRGQQPHSSAQVRNFSLAHPQHAEGQPGHRHDSQGEEAGRAHNNEVFVVVALAQGDVAEG